MEEQWLQQLFIGDAEFPGMGEIVLNLTIPFFLAFIVATTYRKTQPTYNYSMSFLHAILLFSSLSSVVTMLIGNNLARAFGLLGALSIIRFRNALKDPIDAVYIFWALIIGMACGTGYYLLATTVTLFCSAAAFGLYFMKFGSPRQNEIIIRIEMDQGIGDQPLSHVWKELKQFSRVAEKLNSVIDDASGRSTHMFMLRTRIERDLGELQKRVKSIQGVHHAVCVENHSQIKTY